MRPARSFFLAAACAALCSISAPAWSQPSPKDKIEAITLTSSGRTALKEGRFQDAITALSRANELDPTAPIKVDLARAQAGAGRLVDASTTLHGIDRAAATTPLEKQATEDSKKLLAEIEARIPWLLVTIQGPKDGKASATVDGKEVDVTAEVPLDPGEHTVKVEADGWKPREEKVTLAEGVHEEVKVQLERDAPPPPPPPPPVPDAPLTPPPEPKPSKKERPKIKDDAASWARWNAAPRKEEPKSSSRPKTERTTSKRSADKSSSKDSGSDKAERADKAEKTPGKVRMSSMFTSTPPISRSMSTRDKRASISGKSSSRRHSVDMHGLASPPPEELPEMSSKAAKILGVDKSSSKKKARRVVSPDEDDIVMVGALDPETPAPKRDKRRSRRPQDDDLVMVDAGGPSETPLKRGLSASKKSGFAGLFSGLMTPKSARDANPDNDAVAVDTDRDIRSSDRKAKRSDRDPVDRDEARRERRRKREDEDEARRLEAKEARRAEKRAARQREDEERRIDEEKEARRAERRRLRKEKEAAAVAAERDEAERRAAKQERRRSQMVEGSEDEAERRRRREARRAAKAEEGGDVHRRRSSRNPYMSADDTAEPRKRSKRDKMEASAWPHSGTSSWVKEHSDAPPPPNDDEQARREARRAKRRAKTGDAAADEMEEQRRRRRREERERERRVGGGSEGSDERHHSRRGSAFMDATPRSSWWKKITG